MRNKRDWEEVTAAWFGDIIAHRLGRGLRFLQRRCRTSLQRLNQTTLEYLQEEAQQLPPRGEVTAFYADIAALNQHLAQLAARVEQLQHAAPGASD